VRPVVLRGGVEVASPLDVAAGFLERYGRYETDVDSRPMSFAEVDLRRANRGGARISAAEIAVILERRSAIEHALRALDPRASLAAHSVPWAPLTKLFEPFAGVSGVGFSKMTKALHKKRPALIPMLDSVVQAYLPAADSGAPFAERAAAMTRSYKEDVDRNRVVLREVKRDLAARGVGVTEVRLLDLMIWAAFT
jgi:hypothetical protein